MTLLHPPQRSPKPKQTRHWTLFWKRLLILLKKGDKVVLIGFGTFETRKRSARKGRNRRKNLNDGKYLRVEEVYLTKAEALFRLGNEAEAREALDEIRKNRYENFVSGAETGDALLQAILLERRLELAFEGDRFFTLKRLGLPLQRSDKGEFADGTGTAPLVQNYPADGLRWQLPIPRSAIDANPELAEDQNPGYEN